MWWFFFQWVPKHREPDDVDPKDMLRELPPKEPNRVWIRCCDGEIKGPCEVKYFKGGRIMARPYPHGSWFEIYPDGTGTSFLKEWWPDDDDE